MIMGKEFLQTVNGICISHVNIYVDAKIYVSFFIKENQMKTIATLIAGLFAVTAFAAEPVAPAAAPAELKLPAKAPSAPVKMDAVTKQDKHDVAKPVAKAEKPAKSEDKAPVKADAKAATPAATVAPAAK
jgi:hypothetical protein